MKKTLLKSTKRVSIFALVILLVFSLVACSSFEQRLTGLTEAMTFMIGEPNLSSSEVVTIRLSDNAAPISLADFIDAMTDADYLKCVVEIIENLEISIASEVKIYNDSMSYSIYWVGPEDVREEIIRIVYIGEDLYISTAILRTIGPAIAGIVEDEELLEVLALLDMIGDADYLHIQVPAMMSLAEIYADEYVAAFLENFDLADIISTLGSIMTAELESAVERSLTRDFDQALQEIDGEYIVTMDTRLAIEFTKAILQLAIDYSEEVTEFLADMVEIFFLHGEELSAEERAEGMAYHTALAKEALAFLDNEFISNIPLINFEYRVKASGEGLAKVQTSSTWLELPAETIDVLREQASYYYIDIPFQKFEISASQTTTIQTTPITAPQGQIFSLAELFGDFMSATVMHHFDHFDFDDWDISDALLEDLEAIAAEVDLNQLAADFGIDLSQFGIDLSNINMDDIESALNEFEIDLSAGARFPRPRNNIR